MKIRKLNVLSIAISLLGLYSCSDGDFEYSKYHSAENQQLSYDDTMSYQYNPVDTGTHQIYLSVRHTKEYEFSNIWFKIIENDTQVSRVDIPLFDKAGTPLGKVSGAMITRTILWRDFNAVEQDSMILDIVQNMRKNPLGNISEVGVIILKEGK